ncbi:MAG: amidohydrolase [Chloroflexi bacterium]|nr:amidohydrolase [Chloroflexota bacterium]
MLRVGGHQVPLVDCDVHEYLKSPQELLPYVKDPWRRYFTECKFRGLQQGAYTETGGGGRRADSWPSDGSPSGSSYELLKQQLLDQYGVDYAILQGAFYRVSGMPQSDFANVLASAYNDWLVDNWLSKDQRLKGSVNVNVQDPAAAAREIDRMGDHPDIVQLLLSVTSQPGFGHPMYDPLWEACSRHDLVVTMHLNNPAGSLFIPPTPLGWPRYYMEWRCAATLTFQAQLINLVCEGVFERFPKLKVVFVEGGFSWVSHLLIRMDLTWQSLRLETPWLKRKPSEYVRDHCYFTTQPTEFQDDVDAFLRLVDGINGQRRLMFATDYPHWDFDSPLHALPKELGFETRSRILGRNALELFGLPEPSPMVDPAPGEARTAATRG